MVTTSMDVLDWLRKHLKETDADVLREIVSTFTQALMSAEAEAVCGAGYGERSGAELTNSRNGYRIRDWDTRVGRLDLAISKLLSKSQVSELATSLKQVTAFRNRPLDRAPDPDLWLDALVQRCREHGRIVNVATVIATGVNPDGHREILGVDVFTTEDGASWTAFLRGLVAWPPGRAADGLR